MNVNENLPVLGRGRGKGRQLKVVPIQRTPMGPPMRPAPKRKETSTSAHTTSSSSNINWKPNQKSTQNNSTARTSSSSRSHSSTEPESRVVIALSEGRGEAVGEIGIAAINIARPSLILCQISDTQSYINTLTKINILNPSEILIPLTFIESFTSNRLIEKVKEQFRDVKITGVTRSSFNKTTGLQYIKQLCVPSMNSILLILQHRYYALAAAAALLTYTETALYVIYARESIKIEYQESEGSTIIDVATADRLELVASARPTTKKRFSCLLDILNHCMTKIGGRTLRASILQPPCSVPDIEARLDCVTELVEHADMLAAIQVALSKLANIDQLLTLATVLPDQAHSCSERQLNYILLLNTVLEQIAPLQDVFENSKQTFFIELRTTLQNPAFTEIKDLVRALIHTEAHPGKGQYGMFQRCFAIKSGINSLLDLVRKSYSERLEDMRKYVTDLGEKYSLAMTLHNNHKKGYHILLNLNAHQKKTLKKDDLPPECFQVERLANSYTMKTQDLINLSNQVEDIMAEILKMSNIMIHKLLIHIRQHIGIFYKLCEDIAKLDMLQSLAKASSAMQYVRPKFADYLEVTQARHPLLDFLCSTEPSANSMYASKEYNINIITGPNGSGKSILVRQVILIQVMAQVGCYVPAQSATLRVSDRILARVYLEDNMDCGASAFVLEMKEIQYFLTVLTNNTLIIIDELCRSTSVEEGTAVAMAVCEKLMTTSAFVFFTTHFKFLTKLQDLHFSVKTWQLETLTETIDNQMVLRFTYNVIPGVTSLEHYGIFLAKGSWPEIVINYAEEILKKLSRSHKRPSPHIEQASAAARLKYDLEAELQKLKAKKELTHIKINEKLLGYQRNLEGLGYQVEILLLSDQVNHDNQLSVDENDGNNYNTVLLGNQHESLIRANSDSSINQTGEFLDYFNLQRQSQHSNANDISQTFNQVTVNPSAMQNRHDNNKEIPQFFNFQSIQQIEDSNQGRHTNSLYPENCRFPTATRSFPDNVNPEMYPQNTQKCASPQEYHGSFSDYSYGLNNSVMSERCAHYLQNPENESLTFSYSNVFEPEVILESIEEPEFASSNRQNLPAQHKRFVFQKELTVVGKKAMFMTQDNIFMTSHRNFSFPQEYSYISEKNFITSKDGSIVSKENSISFSKDGSIYEDAVSDYFDSESGFIHRGSTNCFQQPMNADESRGKNESFLSITEQQFSLPLQEHLEKTSTPVSFNLGSPSQPPTVRNRIDMKNKLDVSIFETRQATLKSTPFDAADWSGTDQVNTIHDVPAAPKHMKKSKTNEQQSKSDSTKSDSIKWVASNQNNIFIDPTMFGTTKSNGQSNSTSSSGTKFSMNKVSPQKAISSKERNASSNNTNSKTSTDSIIWNVERNVKNRGDSQQSIHNVTNSHYYSEADITEVLNDLQSCSEYFSDSQDWDFVDEEINSKLNKQAGTSKNDIETKMLEKEPKAHSEYQQNSQNQEKENKIHKEVRPVPTESDLPEFGLDLQKKENSNHEQLWKKQTAPKYVYLQHHKEVLGAKNVSKGIKLQNTKKVKSQLHEMSLIKTKGQCDKGRNVHSTPELQWDENQKHQKQSDDEDTRPQEDNMQHGSHFDAKISKPQYCKEASQIDQGSPNCSEEIQEIQHIHSSLSDEVPVQSKSVEKPGLQHGKEIQVDVEVHKPPSHQLEEICQLQSLPEIPELGYNKELQMNVNAEIAQIKYGETSQAQCSKDQPQPERNSFQMKSSAEEMKDGYPHSNEIIISSHHNKSMESVENENKYPNITVLSSASKNVPACLKTLSKEDNSSQHLQNEQMKIERNYLETQTDQKTDGDQQNSTLEPLGDIHLELFSDESSFHESENQTKEENRFLNKSPTYQYDNLLPTDKENPMEILPVDGGKSKILVDCIDAVPGQSKTSLTCKKNVNTTDEYETAHSVLGSSHDESIFFNSIDQAPSSTPNDNKRQQEEFSQTEANLSQKPKRRRLGYVTKNYDDPSPLHSSPVQEMNKPTFNRETSPDIFEENREEIYPLYKNASGEMSQTPSDFESSKNTKSTHAVNSPLKRSSKNSYEQKVPKKKNVHKSKIPKFIPPRILTKKEIELDFYEQDKKMLESEDSSKYLEQIINRPTVRQLQQTKHIASIHKTSSGVVVVPAKERKVRKRKFVTPLKKRSEKDFDVTLFSDRNSDKFEHFMNNNNVKQIMVRQDVKNQFIESEVVSKKGNKENVITYSKSTDENSSGKTCEKVQKYKVKILQNIALTTARAQKSGIVKHAKEGYYTQNKHNIDNIVDKYLKPEIENTVNVVATSSLQKTIPREFDSSIFSQSTVILDMNDD